MTYASQRGFTLIELMVSITIITILSVGGMVAFNNARAGARDAKRYSVLAQMQLLLETYRQLNGSYPSTGGTWWGVTPAYGSHGVTGASGYVPNLASTYINVLPLDPVSSLGYKSTDTDTGYLYKSNGTDYKFIVHRTMELKKECDASTDQYWDPVRSATQNTCGIYSSGGSSF